MIDIILYESLFILLTGGAYLLSKSIYRKFPRPYFHTILVSVIIIIAFLYVFDIDYSFWKRHYQDKGFIISACGPQLTKDVANQTDLWR